MPKDVDWRKYLPTPKMTRVLIGGLVTVLLVVALDAVGVDIRDEVKALAPVIVAGVWGFAKTDASSPRSGDG